MKNCIQLLINISCGLLIYINNFYLCKGCPLQPALIRTHIHTPPMMKMRNRNICDNHHSNDNRHLVAIMWSREENTQVFLFHSLFCSVDKSPILKWKLGNAYKYHYHKISPSVFNFKHFNFHWQIDFAIIYRHVFSEK